MSEKNNTKNNTGEKYGFLNKILSSRKIINPVRDWISIIIIFSVFVAFDLVFDGIMYSRITSGEMYISVPSSSIKVEMLKTDEIQSIINDYESRKTEISKMSPKNLVDPSL